MPYADGDVGRGERIALTWSVLVEAWEALNGDGEATSRSAAVDKNGDAVSLRTANAATVDGVGEESGDGDAVPRLVGSRAMTVTVGRFESSCRQSMLCWQPICSYEPASRFIMMVAGRRVPALRSNTLRVKVDNLKICVQRDHGKLAGVFAAGVGLDPGSLAMWLCTSQVDDSNLGVHSF